MAGTRRSQGVSDVLTRGVARQDGRPWHSSILRFVRKKPLGAVAALMILLILLLAFVGPLLSPYGQFELDTGHELEGYSTRHWLGTDQWGRDIMTRVFYGARISIAIALGAVTVGAGLGFLWGLTSGYFMGKFDLLSQRVVDALLAIPTLILAMALVVALGTSTLNLVIAIALVFIPHMARVIRSSALSLRERPFVEAARAIGVGNTRIVLRHVGPNCMAPFLVVATAELGSAILVESSLSFLGLGTAEPHASLGAMLSGPGQGFFLIAPWMAIWPGVALSMLVFGFNLFGDALRDVLDPRLRKG